MKCRLLVLSHDAVRVMGTMPVDMVDCLIHRFHNLRRQNIIKILGIIVLLRRRYTIYQRLNLLRSTKLDVLFFKCLCQLPNQLLRNILKRRDADATFRRGFFRATVLQALTYCVFASKIIGIAFPISASLST